MRAATRTLLLGTLALATGCTSFWEQRDYQKVAWIDGDHSRVEVWLRQGSENLGPVGWIGDVLVTPVMWLAEVQFACAALVRENVEITGGPFGFVVSLLPFFTCVPLDHKPCVFLPLSEPLALTAGDRAELAQLGDRGGVEWLAQHYTAANPERAEVRVANVRRWVSAVRLAAPAELGIVPLVDDKQD
jgi:hypothetical protein